MAKTFSWRSSPEIIARLVNGADINTWASRQVVLKPNEACAFIVDGRIGDIVSEDVVRNIGGGITRFIGDLAKMTATDRRMLFAMTGPVDIFVPFEATLSDGSKAQGHANIRMQIRKDDVPKLLNLFANAKPLLDRAGLGLRLQSELMARVVTPLTRGMSDAAELRTPRFQEEFELRSEMEMRSTLSTMGFTMLKAFIVTNATDMEKVLRLRAELKAATETEGAHAEALIERIAIREAATLRRIECEVNVEKAKAAGKVAVELESELKELRKQEAQWEAELRRDTGQAELRMRESSHKTDQAMALFEQVQAKKAARIAAQHDHQNQRMDAQNSLQSDMMKLAAESGALTPEVMQEFLKQQTAQKAVDGAGGEALGAPTLPTNAPASPAAPEAPRLGTCSCGQMLQAGWRACPVCGNPA